MNTEQNPVLSSEAEQIENSPENWANRNELFPAQEEYLKTQRGKSSKNINKRPYYNPQKPLPPKHIATKCLCGTISKQRGRSERDAATLAMVRDGFKIIDGFLWCKLCSRPDLAPRRQFFIQLKQQADEENKKKREEAKERYSAKLREEAEAKRQEDIKANAQAKPKTKSKTTTTTKNSATSEIPAPEPKPRAPRKKKTENQTI